MKTIIGYLVWLALRAFVFVTRRPAVTFRKPDGAPYMTRWALATRDPWPDAQGRTGGEGWYLHRIVASDYERALHNHPASSFAVVLRGGYFEWRAELGGRPLLRRCGERIWRGPLSANILTDRSFHRIELPADKTEPVGYASRVLSERPSWSLFYIGPRNGKGWGFLQPDGTVKRAPHNDGNTGARVARDGTVTL